MRSEQQSHSPPAALLATMTAPLASSVAARPLSPTSSLNAADAVGQPAAKRQRTSKHNDEDYAAETKATTTKTPRKRTSQQLPYDTGMHLAPMVRIGTLPVRLIALEYGAELVWGPEIVDKAIIGAERKVDPIAARTGVVSFLKNGRSIFDCHPLEKSRLIFQLGSASPELAVQAMKVIQHDVAGVGLNCGQETQILTALVQATDLPVDAKIRLLPLPPAKGNTSSSASPSAAAAASLATPVATPPPPPPTDPAQPQPQPQRTPSAILEPTVPPTLTVDAAVTSDTETAAAGAGPSSSAKGEEEEEEPTLTLVARIFDTGIANLTVHCRTQEMRSREPALHERMRGITEMGRQRGVPVVCNGDAVGGGKDAGWGNFDQVCEKTGVSSVMIARAAEANPSCFSRSGLADPISEVIPKLLRVAMVTQNHYNNTKYILNAMSLVDSPTPPTRETNREYKQKMNKAKSYADMAEVFGIDRDEVRALSEEEPDGMARLEALLPRWKQRRDEILLLSRLENDDTF
ncbi:hypothetical protein C6P46_000669 [Rhodotorula mucilaginosa]|uniref:DUS-like FMN-binding domain-containing protein n=1 Tax=Rhodotorula mucilaginosa TaxID=5537 RepID=A0A9P6W7W9_RHOMI|nr:hypothetical protein C6P46_000669 [Rhodotorula mucilaginosa]